MREPELPGMNNDDYKGLNIWHLSGNRENKRGRGIVIGRGFGVPVNIEDERWAYMFHELGYAVAYCHYTGTWFENRNRGDFLEMKEDVISIESDILRTIDFLVETQGIEDITVIGNCFGANPILAASAKRKAVSKIITIGGSIFTDNRAMNRQYLEMDRNIGKKNADLPTDYCLMLGRMHKKEYEHNSYIGFDYRRYKDMVLGKTTLNAYHYKKELADKDYLGIHSYDDRLISYKRTEAFGNTLSEFKRENNSRTLTELWMIHPKDYGCDSIGHRGIEKVPGFHERVFRFLDNNEDTDIINSMVLRLFEQYTNQKDFINRSEYIDNRSMV